MDSKGTSAFGSGIIPNAQRTQILEPPAKKKETTLTSKVPQEQLRPWKTYPAGTGDVQPNDH